MCKRALAKVMSTSDFDPRCSGLLLLEVALVVKVEGNNVEGCFYEEGWCELATLCECVLLQASITMMTLPTIRANSSDVPERVIEVGMGEDGKECSYMCMYDG